ncbi:uncharacterized protein [Typha latifolia]|uniref:uncharacterized protein isoform X2 n=1 Tax=Typha latifolia TaxID=4733 RepID=UPI003C2C1F17
MAEQNDKEYDNLVIELSPWLSMEEGDAFYVVRKGNTVGVYRNFSDCQAQISRSVCDPAVSAYKGYSLSKETEDYLASCGLKNALYTINAADLKEDMFGTLLPCCFQEVSGSNPPCTGQVKRPIDLDYFVNEEPISCKRHVAGSNPASTQLLKKSLSLGHCVEAQPVSNRPMLCILEFDGASKGNPGKAGAGAVLRTEDGRLISRLREGLGVATNNVAEYRAVILGMKYALKKGFRRIHVRGDSQLVCMQVQGLWQTKHQDMIKLCKEVKELQENFLSFEINHMKREFNADADNQANIAINLPNGAISEECGEGF